MNYMRLRNHFKKMNIPGPMPLPLIGNFNGVIKLGATKYDEYLMGKYGKIVGYFEGSTPNLLISDVKFIKAVLIKDFSHFVNRRVNWHLS